jgi:hypothetical protein
LIMGRVLRLRRVPAARDLTRSASVEEGRASTEPAMAERRAMVSFILNRGSDLVTLIG